MMDATTPATTPADLGVRSTLLVDKHAEYIKSFSRLWDVSARSAGPRGWRIALIYYAEHHHGIRRAPTAWSTSPRSTSG
jgi:hypothetical protein